jgi:23S rRNA (adenine2503-C2)-methyltransferase
MQIEKKDIRAVSKDLLRELPKETKLLNQVYEWLWSKGAHSFEDMTNISKETRTMLESNFVINHIKVDTIQRSDDGTICSSFARWFSGGVCFDSTNTRTTAFPAKWVVV